MPSSGLSSADATAGQENLAVLDLIRTAETLAKSGGLEAVRTLYSTWLERNDGDPLLYTVLFNHAVVLADLGDLDQARQALERALALNPAFVPALINLGRVLERQGDIAQAVQRWNTVLTQLPGVTGQTIAYKITALNQIARVLEGANQDAAAEDMLRHSLDLDPSQREPLQHLLSLRQRQCLWPVVAPTERVSHAALMRGMSPLSVAAHTDDPWFQMASAFHYNRTDVGSPGAARIGSHWAAQHAGPLRIGYVSSDLREHAVGYLMAEVFELHDRSRVETFAYYCGPEASDSLHRRFRNSADHWTSISAMSDADAARQIADDGIQILVDVNGYTRDGRTRLFALRPAPVIVNWLGFPGTTGSPYHHYIIADDWIVPPDLEACYSERVLRLPCYQPNDRRRLVSPVLPSRTDLGLPQDATVFCCFNGVHKITRFTFDRWMNILKRVPDSVLWLLSAGAETETRLRRAAQDRGVVPDRLVFAAKAPNRDHLARYPQADLFLDTTPYGAHTTASDALWMGVPVLTCSGRSFASRVCGSLVRAAGLPDLVCASLDEYVDRAVALGRDRATLRAYRSRLEAARDSSVLFDSPGLVRGLEGLYAEMWQASLAGQIPRPDLANLDTYLEIGCATDYEAFEAQQVADDRAWWRERLAARHAERAIEPDRRLAAPPHFP
jgi:predicted O-linked N-acetylglucosamine transferase (SPINDLY family)